MTPCWNCLSNYLPSSTLIVACPHCIKLLSKVYVVQHLEALVMRLTLRHRLTTNKHQHSDPIVCCCGFIKYIHCPWFGWFGWLYFAHWIRWWRSTWGQTTSVLLLICYTVCNMIQAYIACVLLASILWHFSCDSHASVKFKLSCTVLLVTAPKNCIKLVMCFNFHTSSIVHFITIELASSCRNNSIM